MKVLIKDPFLKEAFISIMAAEGQPRWKEFLKEKYEGGKKIVPNTDNKTKIKYPQVSMNTLYKKDPNFKNKVNREYKQWLGSDTQQQDLFSKEVDKETEVSLVSVGGRKVPKDQKKFEKKAQSFFKKLNPESKEWITKFKSNYDSAQDKHVFLSKAAVDMPDFFDQFLKSDKTASRFKFGRSFDQLLGSWQSGSGLKKSWDIHGFANKLDFNGDIYYGEPDSDDEAYEDATKQKWGQNVYFYEYNALSYAYAFQQELFKQMGLKSFEVYRGVRDDVLLNEISGGSRSKEDSVKIKTRPTASTSNTLAIGKSFGNVCLSFEVPIENIILSPFVSKKLSSDGRTYGGIFDEDEYVVAGLIDIPGKIVSYENEG